MYKIDSHIHLWEYDAQQYPWVSREMEVLKKNYLPDDLVSIFKKECVDGCVAIQARQSDEENDFLIQCANKNSHIKGVVGWVDLQNIYVAEELEKWSSHSIFKGVRHIVQDEKDPRFLQRMAFVDGIKLLDIFDLTYDLLIYERQMPSAIKLMEKIPDQKVVLDHIGKPLIKERLTNNWKDSISTLGQFPNLCIKISGMVTETNWKKWQKEDFVPFLDHVVESFGIDRIMIGSDWPVCLLAANHYGEVMNIAEEYFSSFATEDKNKIFTHNATRFYGL